MFLTVFVR